MVTKPSVPPCSDDAEMAVLGSLFKSQDKLLRSDIFQMLTPDHFFYERHRDIYRAMDTVFARSDDIDFVLVKEILVGLDKLESSGGVDYLVRITDYTPSSANIKYYAEIVRDKYLLRRTMILCNKYGNMASCNEAEAKDILEELQSQMDVVSSEAGVVDDKDCVSDHIYELADEIKNRTHGTFTKTAHYVPYS